MIETTARPPSGADAQPLPQRLPRLDLPRLRAYRENLEWSGG
jgi:hypothetical protein